MIYIYSNSVTLSKEINVIMFIEQTNKFRLSSYNEWDSNHNSGVQCLETISLVLSNKPAMLICVTYKLRRNTSNVKHEGPFTLKKANNPYPTQLGLFVVNCLY
jgi:hypothetical protein